jgi:hypothetical protein
MSAKYNNYTFNLEGDIEQKKKGNFQQQKKKMT